MDVLKIPFNEFLGIEASAYPDLVYALPESDRFLNHVGTVHAMAQAALAEAASGEFCYRCLPNRTDFLPLLRKMEVKFLHPARGRLSARASVDDEVKRNFAAILDGRGKGFLRVDVDVVDASGEVTMTARVEWYVAKNDAERR